jgi:hypothetical protein
LKLIWSQAERSDLSKQLVGQRFVLGAKLGRAASIGIGLEAALLLVKGGMIAHQGGPPNRARS